MVSDTSSNKTTVSPRRLRQTVPPITHYLCNVWVKCAAPLHSNVSEKVSYVGVTRRVTLRVRLYLKTEGELPARPYKMLTAHGVTFNSVVFNMPYEKRQKDATRKDIGESRVSTPVSEIES